MKTIRDVLGAFLFGLLLLWAVTAHACGFGYSASYVSASYGASYYAAPVAYVQYIQAPATYTYAAVAAPVCPPVAEVQAPAPVQAPAYVLETMPYATAAYYGAGLNSYGLNSYGYSRASFNGYGSVGRRAFFRSDAVDVRISPRRFFAASNRAEVRQRTVTRSVTRTRTTLR